MEYSAVSTMWVLLGAALVFFMQAGFAMLETGFTRAKNAGNIIMKNLIDFSIAAPIYWLIGFGLMFGNQSGLIGGFDFMTQGDYSSILPEGVPLFAFLIFQTIFCGTAATIVSGAMAERTKFASYCVYSLVISLFVYPVSGHWIWGGGWLAELGFHDFAGSTAVHMVGGIAAFIGAMLLGPRIGKYGKDGKAKAIPGHSLTLGALGVFILWFGWFGFNGASTVSMEGDAIINASKIFVTTNLSATVATLTVMCITWVRYKKPDISMTLNGSLAGLVAITAGCDTLSPGSAALVGMIAGFLVVFGIEWIEKKLKVDDPVGAVGVHGICGGAGTLLVGLFSDGSGTNGMKGFLLSGDLSLFKIQLIGVFCVALWVTITMTLVFWIMKKTIGLRVEKEVELAGLDSVEHGLVSSYADFMPNTVLDLKQPNVSIFSERSQKEVIPIDEAIPTKVIEEYKKEDNDKKTQINKIDIICNQGKFEDLKEMLNEIGVNGITVTQVLGCGIQRGNTKFYRGVPIDMILLPKIRVEVVISKIPTRAVIEAVKKTLYSGNIGDGKIFIYQVENVVKVRTGEEGYDALQGNIEDELV